MSWHQIFILQSMVTSGFSMPVYLSLLIWPDQNKPSRFWNDYHRYFLLNTWAALHKHSLKHLTCLFSVFSIPFDSSNDVFKGQSCTLTKCSIVWELRRLPDLLKVRQCILISHELYGLDRIAFPWFQTHARVINDFELVYNQALSFSEKCIVRRWKGCGMTCSINIHENFPFTLVIDTFLFLYILNMLSYQTRYYSDFTWIDHVNQQVYTSVNFNFKKDIFFLENICLIQLQPSLLFSDSQLKSMILNKF